MEIAKIFQNGKSQAVRLPKEFRFQSEKVFIKKMGNAVVLLPCEDAWQTWLDNLGLFSDDFMETRDQPEQQIRESLFA